VLIHFLDPVCATLVHLSGSVVATVSGKDRHQKTDSMDDDSSDDSSDESEVTSASIEPESSDSEDEMQETRMSVPEQTKTEQEKSSADGMVKIWSIA
jgi:hypothetical protein